MKKTIELLKEVMKMGFCKDDALEGIDASLDTELGYENRTELCEEEISEELYGDIILGFKCVAESR